MPNINLIYYLLAGGIFGALALKTGIPAAPLAGALIGASILSISGKVDIAEWPIGTRTILEIGIGTVIGTSLTKDSLMDLQTLWRPAILITFTLVITGLAIGLWTSRLLNIDVITTILGAAPGGISGMSLVGSEYGVGAAVATLHFVFNSLAIKKARVVFPKPGCPYKRICSKGSFLKIEASIAILKDDLSCSWPINSFKV